MINIKLILDLKVSIDLVSIIISGMVQSKLKFALTSILLSSSLRSTALGLQVKWS